MNERKDLVVVVAPPNDLPGVPGDVPDHGGDYESYQWVGDRPADADEDRGDYDASADERIDLGVVAIGD